MVVDWLRLGVGLGGAKRVVVTAPSPDAPMFVVGVNEVMHNCVASTAVDFCYNIDPTNRYLPTLSLSLSLSLYLYLYVCVCLSAQ
jgi:hypothetical protein